MTSSSRGPGPIRRKPAARVQGRRFTEAQRRGLGRTALAVVLAGVLIAVAAAGLLAGAALAVGAHLPSVDALYELPSEATRIYAADGQLIASLYRENRDSVPLTRVAHRLQRAVIDTEDADFYRHRGISVRGVLRAVLRNLYEKGFAEGGSTITQQLARNMFLTSEKSLTRKIAEVLLAVQIERRLTKDEILERYLNQVYFGQGAYGIETAAEVYFGKHAGQLSLPESAMLAGLIRAPSFYSPYEHLDRARGRMSEVLLRMTESGDITPAEMRRALHAPLHFAEKTNAGLIGIRAPYFVSYILPGLLQRYGEDVLYKGGLRVYTTLDLGMQAAAEAAVRRAVDEARRNHLRAHQAALVAIDPQTGYVRAMIGGYDFRKSQFNRAWQAHRQPGSAFKPFTYTVAVMRGIPPTHILVDAPIEFPLPDGTVWRPTNYDHKWHGEIPMRYALENSINVATIRLEQEVGPKAIVDLAHRMGIESPLQPNLSLTLGASDVTLLEMVSAYGVFADGGIRAAPLAVTKVTDYHGKVLEEHLPDRHVVLSPGVAYLMTDLLKGVVQRGTGTAANIGIPQAGKTGTSDDFRNAWFIGFTPSIVAGVWMGNDDDSPMDHVPGGSVPARTWAVFLKQILPRIPKDDWAPPQGVVRQPVCAGDTASPAGCAGVRPEVFIRGTEPDSAVVPAPEQPASSSGPAQPSTGALGPAAGSPAAASAGAAPKGIPIPTASTGSAAGARATPPVVITAPTQGTVVGVPLTVRGASRPGTLVHITVTSSSGLFKIDAADVYVLADGSGNFSYQVNPWFRPSGATLTITVVAPADPDGVAGAGTATVSVRIR